MRGPQEDMGEMLVNLGASRTNSVSIYSEKTQNIGYGVLVFAFRDGNASSSGYFCILAKYLVQISSVKSPRRGSSMKESS